jgi:hypothetical protein
VLDADFPVRTAISIGQQAEAWIAYFGDQHASAYADNNRANFRMADKPKRITEAVSRELEEVRRTGSAEALPPPLDLHFFGAY